MNTSLNFRTLTSNEVIVRVGNTKKENNKVVGYFLLLYKDARVDMNVLDETVGTMNWQRKHTCLNGNIYCSVGIRDENSGEWIWKEDCGFCDGADEIGQKGTASDSFKRACFNIGIGRELYTAPLMWINGSDTNTRYSVSSMEVSPDHVITQLTIINSKTKEVVFDWSKDKGRRKSTTPSKDAEALSKAQDCKTADEVLTIYNLYKDSIGKDAIAEIVKIGGNLRSQEKIKKAA